MQKKRCAFVLLLCVLHDPFPSFSKGNKVDFHLAMSGDAAKTMYCNLVSELRKNHAEDKIMDGQFGAMMEVNIANDGPVTIELESLSKAATNQEPQNQ